MNTKTSGVVGRPFWLHVTLVLFVGLVFRLLFLDTAPGVSGDEADVWVRLHDFILGRPVTWECPTGKSISPLYLATLFPFEVLLPTHFISLRVPGVLFGLLTAGLSFFLTRRLFGDVVAIATGLLAFSLPMHMVYSRLFIEQSLMGITVMCTLYYALRGRSVGATAWYAAALLLHPVNVFMTPLVLAAYFHHLFFESRSSRLEQQIKTGLALFTGAIGIVAIVRYVPADAFNNTWNHLRHIEVFPKFLFLFFRIFSGTTPIEDIAGNFPGGVRFLWDGLFLVLILAGLGLGARSLARARNSKALVLLGAWCASLFIFFAVGGFIGVRPGLQRHSLFLMVPTLWVLVLCWQSVVRARALLWGSAAVSTVFLVLFGFGFLLEFHQSGGTSHSLYQSAQVEPKQAVFEWLDRKSEGKPVRVLTEDWWTFHPIRYLAKDKNTLELAMMFHLNQPLPWEQVQRFFEPGGFVVAWTGGSLEKMVQDHFGPRAVQAKVFENQASTPLLRVWQIDPAVRLVSPLS